MSVLRSLRQPLPPFGLEIGVIGAEGAFDGTGEGTLGTEPDFANGIGTEGLVKKGDDGEAISIGIRNADVFGELHAVGLATDGRETFFQSLGEAISIGTATGDEFIESLEEPRVGLVVLPASALAEDEALHENGGVFVQEDPVVGIDCVGGAGTTDGVLGKDGGSEEMNAGLVAIPPHVALHGGVAVGGVAATVRVRHHFDDGGVEQAGGIGLSKEGAEFLRGAIHHGIDGTCVFTKLGWEFHSPELALDGDPFALGFCSSRPNKNQHTQQQHKERPWNTGEGSAAHHRVM